MNELKPSPRTPAVVIFLHFPPRFEQDEKKALAAYRIRFNTSAASSSRKT